jgi:serine/threonine-protein kinase
MHDIPEALVQALADRYQLERELGQGGMATVYLAQDLKHDRKVAVKVLRPELAAVIGAERFLNEIKVTANLQHPHILPLHDSGEADSFLYYVMPFVEGETLREKLDREKELGIDEALDITRAVAGALDYAHRNEVIHRDIKPANILLHDGQALVADFGIALAVSAASGARLTETGLSVGTPHYMSPEQAMGDRELDARSDLYSLGCMLYEMLAGEPPYTGPTAQAIIAKVVTGEPKPVTASRKTVPPHIDAAINQAIAKLPADRFSSASEFAEALTKPGYVSTFTGAGAAATAAGLASKRSSFWAGAAAVAAAALVIGVFSGWWLRPEPEKKVARFTIQLPEGQDIGNRFGTTSVLSPDGRNLVYIGPGEGGIPQLWLRPIDQLEGAPIPGTIGAYSPFISPDGQSVAFLALPPSLRVVSLAGGPPLTLTDSATPVGGAWGADGMLYFTHDRTDGIARVPESGGDVEVLTVPDTTGGINQHRWVDALPNGKGALFARWTGVPEDVDINVVSYESGEIRSLLRGVYALYAPTGHIVYARSDGALLAAPFDQGKLELIGPSTPLLEGIVVKQGAAAEFTISNDGSLLYQSGERPTEQLVWIERDGAERPLDPTLELDFEYVVLSPDGTRLALSYEDDDGQDVWIYDLAQRTLSRLTFEGNLNQRPEWTPDGTHVTFMSDRSGERALHSKPADGSGPAEVTVPATGRPVQEAEWSRDGRFLVFREGPGGATSRDLLYIEPGVDSTPKTFLASEFDELAPALSPDGRWLAYTSNESGRDEIYVRPFPGPGGRWQISTDGGQEPLWAHSGGEIFFIDGQSNMVAAEVSLNPTFSVGQRQVLFSAAEYERDRNHVTFDVTPDGQTFLMIKQIGGSRDVVVVLNWFEEMLERVGQ